MGKVNYDFKGEHVLVTGASRGIGYAVAKGFAQAGARVSIMSSGASIKDAAIKIESETKLPCTALQCDISDAEAVKDTLADIDQIDILINNAGLEKITPIMGDDEIESTFRRITDININGTFYVTRHCLPKMIKGGRIIMTASIWSRVAVAEFAAYVSSKHANLGFTRVMARELATKDIRVNAVCPGWVRTDAAMMSLRKMSETTGRNEQDLLNDIIAAQSLPGLLEADDVVSAYLFLASDGAKDMTGQALMIDRGEVMA